MKTRLLLLLVIWLFSGLPSAHAEQTPRKPLIIDTDMAADDWLAIAYLLHHPDVEVKAITVTGAGEAHCEAGVQNALNLIALIDEPGIPVSCGRETPLVGNRTFPDEWRQNVDEMLGITMPHNATASAAQPAPDLLVEIISTSPQSVTLITLGPLTNVAETVQTEPDLIKNLEAVYIMGGAVDVAGNVASSGVGINNEVAEWNFYVDPTAADIVFRSGAPLVLVSLDATNTTPVTLAFLKKLQMDRVTPAAEFVYQVLERQAGAISAGWYSFWDPLMAVLLTDPTLATFTERRLIVITGEGRESGATRADDAGSPIMVASKPDAERFETIFLNVLNARDPE